MAREDRLTIDTLCLLLRRLGDRLWPLPRIPRRKDSLREPIAKEVLRAIWAEDELWRAFAWNAFSEQLILCLYAHVEGQDHYIASWLRAEVPDNPESREKYGDLTERWRG